jgi:hypothetical protein
LEERRFVAEESKYSPDVIRRYREMDRNGSFNRKITERIPVTPDRDRVVLTCGDAYVGTASLRELALRFAKPARARR